MNLFALASLSLSVICFFLAFIIFLNAKRRLHFIWGFMNVAITIFGLGTYLVGTSKTYDKAFLSWQIAFLGIPYIAVLFYHIVHEFCNLKSRWFLWFAHLHAAAFALTAISTRWIVNDLEFRFDQLYYYVAGIGFNSFFFFWVIFVMKGLVNLFQFNLHAQGFKRIQGQYFLLGTLIGFTSGATTAIPSYGIDIYPAWHFFVCVYAAIQTYATLRFQLLDIRVAVTRIGVFVIVYSLILGIPFGITFWGKEFLTNIFGQQWYWIPVILSTIFATAGAFIFLYLQRKAEEALLQEEQRTQDLLMQASYGMNTIHKLQKLLDLIVTIVVKTLKVNGGRIFLLNREADKFELKAPEENNGTVFSHDDPLVDHLRQKQYPIIYDEVKVLSEMNGEKNFKDVEAQMRGLPAHLIVPITLNNSLLGFLVLGERQSKDMYSKGLLNALSVLGHQAAIAIDRCIYLEAETKRLEDEGLKERILSLDHMASSMAHEIDNPMHSVNVTAGFIRDLLKDARVRYLPAEVLNEFHAALDRIKVSGERVSGIVKAILDYSKMGQGKGEFKPVNIKEAVEGFSYLIEGEKKKEMVRLDIQAEDNLPPILGDRIQLEEIFVNFVRNAIHAVKHKPKEDRRVILKIFKKDYKTIRIECIDDGYGIEKNLLKDIFLANVTTKGSSEGTGLGLHRVRKIVDAFGGKVWAESEGKDKGATLIVELPSYDGDKIARMDILNHDKEKKEDKKGKKKDNEKNEKDRKDEG